MKIITNKTKIIMLFILILFISGFGLFWMDYIGLVDMQKYVRKYAKEHASVMETKDDEPSLVEREEFEKEKHKLSERIEDLDKREASLGEKEKGYETEKEKYEEMKKGLDVEKRKFEDEKKQYLGYMKNVKKLADKINSMPPLESVKIIEKWEDPLIIDVLRQMDKDAEDLGKQSITSYLITLMQKEKASRIMYLMTQI